MTPFRRRTRAARQDARGQSLVEFALILPILVGIFGATSDFARVYQSWITLQNATRSAAEMAASNASTSGEALSLATATVCSETTGLAGFEGTPTSCTNPGVSVTSFTRSASDPGATTKHPLATVTVRSTFDFRSLFAYPLVTDGGTWTVVVEESYSVLQHR